MWFSLKSPTTLKKVPLDILQSQSNWPWDAQGHKSPGSCFIKAGKRAVADNLHGSLDALAWGKIPSVGSGGHFDILYSAKGHELARPEDIYKLLGSQTSCHEQNLKVKVPITCYQTTTKCGAQLVYANGDSASKGCKSLEKISKSVLRSFLSLNDIQKLSRRLKFILQK
ncbi:DNA-directed RNA polymerase IV subunit 1 [Vitis vinifera]|uniref:DNA-directed RNA polymerase IV subunit 1 n=1 Tax=Vitis vinifera TaxID=29760 RepID=A0A438BZ90_VITVI|nr:DNA-directed RNA polymerase IV subunit 1 [Vitis vinifera]